MLLVADQGGFAFDKGQRFFGRLFEGQFFGVVGIVEADRDELADPGDVRPNKVKPGGMSPVTSIEPVKLINDELKPTETSCPSGALKGLGFVAVIACA